MWANGQTCTVPDLYTVHFVVWFGDVDTSVGGSTVEAFHMRCQRMILGIRWHDFVRNTEVVDRTNLPSVRDVIAKRRNSLFGHVVRLDDHTPAHRALSQVAAARTGHRFGPGWRRQPGRPRHSWIQQIGDGTPFSIRAEWSKARRRGHSGLTQRTSAVYAI